MGISKHITTYQIDESVYNMKYGTMLLDGCRKMYPTKKIIASLEFNDTQVLLSVYATDIQIENHTSSL